MKREGGESGQKIENVFFDPHRSAKISQFGYFSVRNKNFTIAHRKER